MEKQLRYLKETYDPLSIIVYGSYADGSQSAHSDFDALVVTAGHEPCRDTAFVDGTQLDVFVYPAEFFSDEIDWAAFARIADGRVVLDTDGTGAAIWQRAAEHVKNQPPRSRAEILADVRWCRKMKERTARGDAEGLFRWHWVLVDSLEIFCELMHQPYRGPKKSLRWMQREHPSAFACYEAALAGTDEAALEKWIACLEERASAEA